MKKFLLISVVLVIISFTLDAQAAEVTVSVTQAATIDSQCLDAGRLLFKFDLPKELNGAFIDYAEVIFKAEPIPVSSRRAVIGGFPLSNDWNESSVSWNYPWSSDGGDYVDTIMASCLVSDSEQRLTSLDVTEILRLWVEKKISNFGLILMDLDRADGKLKLQETTMLPQGAKAQVRVFYTGPEVKK